ncbi:MAG: hypothetical protein V2A54_07355 [Bacteroidota bacterium]
MKNKISFLFAVLMFVCTSLIAQNDILKIKQTATVKASPTAHITSDNIGNLYVYDGSTIHKYDLAGALLYTYSETRYGEIAFVDASQPLKILVFFRDFSKLILLDNTMSIISPVSDLNAKGWDQVTLVCNGRNNEFVFYDEKNFELVKTDLNLKSLSSSGNLTAILGISLKPDFLLAYDNFILLNNPSNGILVFDEYGSYLKTIQCKDCAPIQAKDEKLFTVKKGILKTIGLKTNSVSEQAFPTQYEGVTIVYGNYFFVHDNDCIKIYRKD